MLCTAVPPVCSGCPTACQRRPSRRSGRPVRLPRPRSGSILGSSAQRLDLDRSSTLPSGCATRAIHRFAPDASVNDRIHRFRRPGLDGERDHRPGRQAVAPRSPTWCPNHRSWQIVSTRRGRRAGCGAPPPWPGPGLRRAGRQRVSTRCRPRCGKGPRRWRPAPGAHLQSNATAKTAPLSLSDLEHPVASAVRRPQQPAPRRQQQVVGVRWADGKRYCRAYHSFRIGTRPGCASILERNSPPEVLGSCAEDAPYTEASR